MRAREPDAAGRCAMQQVSDWLEKLGLGQYAQRFAENDIDFALFTTLTDAIAPLPVIHSLHSSASLAILAAIRRLRRG
jgi:SAM domain (Sterile alpha motif)